MPVSSPSYFPPAGSGGQIVGTTAGNGATGVRTFLAGSNAGKFTQPVNDLIVVGDNADSAGTAGAPVTDATLRGAIVVGSQAAQALTAGNSTAGIGAPQYASIVLGFNAAQAVVNLTSSIVIGANALKTYAGTSASNQGVVGSVILGVGAMERVQIAPGFTNQPSSSVVIGAQAAQGNTSPNNFGGVQTSVIIGAQAAQSFGNAGVGGGNISTSVIIGETACQSIALTNNVSGLVVIGEASGSGMTGAALNNTLVGFNITGAFPAMQASTALGALAQVTASSTLVLGAGAISGAMGPPNTGGIFIGTGAGSTNGVAGSDQFLVETFIGITKKAVLAGNLGNGTLVVGNSTQGVDRDQQGTNTLKIINGVIGGANPIGGGYFYVTGGLLHWVDSAGVDSQLSRSAAGQLAANALAAYTNNAGAAAGTLTNAPVAGNPTKWIPINDNGTIRNVPAW